MIKWTKRWPHGGVYEDLSNLFEKSELDKSTKETLERLVDEGAFDRINAISPADLKTILSLAECEEDMDEID